jgi:dihydrofolate synthase/folylpolyglutamate synthase
VLILEALFAAEGICAGTYMSPHIEDLCERIRVDRRDIARQEIVGLANAVLPVLEARKAKGPTLLPTFFELMTALAFLHFAKRNVDWAIVEVGLGGRLDATNIVSPRLVAITSIGLEHTQLLGNTIESIAREKGGIIKRGVPVVIGELPPAAESAVRGIALEQRAELSVARTERVRSAGKGLISVEGAGSPLEAGPIRGPALRADLAIALGLFETALGRGSPRRDRIEEALGMLELPARAEFLPHSPPVVLDGAHTAESLRALGATLDEERFPRPRLGIISIAQDKDLDRLRGEIDLLAEEFIFTRADVQRSRDPQELADRIGRGTVVVEPRQALEEALRRGLPLVVTGSFYLAGALRRSLRVQPPVAVK